VSNCAVSNRARVLRCLWAVCASVLLASCGGSSYNSNGTGTNKPITTGFLRLVNTLPDSPTLLAGLDGNTLTSVSFGQATALQQLATGKYAINVQYVDPDAKTVTLISKEQVTVNTNEQETVFIVGTLSDRHTKTVLNPVPNIAAGNAEVQVMQTVQNQSLDVYLTDASADIGTSPKLATVAFDQTSDLTTVPSGANYRLRVTEAGSTTVLYDSGVFPISELTRVIFVVINYYGPGGSGFRVVQLSNQGSTNFPNEVLPVAFRVANMIPDLPLADLYIGPVAGTPAFAGVPFGTVATAQLFAPGILNCTLTPAGDPTTVLFTGSGCSVIVTAGETRTLVLTKAGLAVVSRASVDNTRPISSEGQLQIINAAPSSAQPDMFLIAAGGSLTGATAKVVNQPLLSIASAVASAGDYDVAFTATASTTAIAGPVPLTIENGGIYTVYAIDAAGGGPPYQVVITTF
jgi:hypothetical protein